MSRPGTVAPLVLIMVLLGAGDACAQLTSILQARPRDPQVTVNGTGLRDYLGSVGETIDPTLDQLDVELLASSQTALSAYTMAVSLELHADASTFGLYNGHDATPAYYAIFTPHARAGWFANVSFRTSPVRAVVNTFDGNAVLQSSITYPGADKTGVGFYVAGPQGVLHSQDHRNPGGAAKVLFFGGTGVTVNAAWLAFESGTGEDSDSDFDDAVLFVEDLSVVCVQCDGSPVTPVRRARWGEVKSRFR